MLGRQAGPTTMAGPSTRMRTRRFVTTRLQQDPRALARLTRELACEYINIEGFSYEEGLLRLLTDHPDKAVQVLEDLDITARIEELLQYDLDNDAGGLARVTDALFEGGVEVTASFCHTGAHGAGSVFLRVNDLASADKVLDRLQPLR